MRRVLALTSLLLLGAGCTNLPFTSNAPEYPAEEIDLPLGDSFTLTQGLFTMGAQNERAVKNVVVEEHQGDRYAVVSWTMDVRRETAASTEARQYALTHTPVGEEAQVPDAVYEDVTLKGVLRTTSLGNAERILLPAYWPEGEYDFSAEQNSLLWLSQAQYDELVLTRNSHIQLGLFDSTLHDLLNVTDTAKTALDRLQGKIAASPTSNKDFTKLTANGDFGKYTLTLDGKEVGVKTLEASNAFAHYTILANRDNPLILKVSVLPWALGPAMFSSLSELNNDLQYSVTSISQSSASQPQP